MKEIKVKFNNVWDDYGDCEKYEIIIFCIPDEIEIDIQKESDILNACCTILSDMEDENELINTLKKHDIITQRDMKYAKEVLDYDGNSCAGLVARRIADFICKKYPTITWNMQSMDCDIKVDIL